jgi:hypothetical protein
MAALEASGNDTAYKANKKTHYRDAEQHVQ